MKQHTSETPEGVEYSYYKCSKCGEEIVDLKQLHSVADKYREMKKAKLSRWGASLGLRIPKDLVKKYKLSAAKEVNIIPEKDGILILTS